MWACSDRIRFIKEVLLWRKNGAQRVGGISTHVLRFHNNVTAHHPSVSANEGGCGNGNGANSTPITMITSPQHNTPGANTIPNIGRNIAAPIQYTTSATGLCNTNAILAGERVRLQRWTTQNQPTRCHQAYIYSPLWKRTRLQRWTRVWLKSLFFHLCRAVNAILQREDVIGTKDGECYFMYRFILFFNGMKLK